MKKITLYKHHVNGIGTWSIWYIDNVIYYSWATVIGGSEQTQSEVITEGKQSRSIHEQVLLRIRARVRKQLDKGYVSSLEKAQNTPVNVMRLPLPMLAQSGKRVSYSLKDAFLQPKLDGFRCMIANIGGEKVAYTRQGRKLDTIDHILESIDMPEGAVLDGELYFHGVKLQTIASWAKRKQADTQKLEYHVFDLVSDESFRDRLHESRSIVNRSGDAIKPVSTTLASEVNFTEYFKSVKSNGYEGVIVRLPNMGYETGVRSRSLIKVKSSMDAEYRVYDITPSKDGWAILHCADDRISFRVSAPGDMSEKYHIMENKSDYIGKYVTVEFSDLTKDGVPFHPVALRFRDDV